jgi:hypothetical protein
MQFLFDPDELRRPSERHGALQIVLEGFDPWSIRSLGGLEVGVPEENGYRFERYPFFKQADGKGIPEAVGMGVLHACGLGRFREAHSVVLRDRGRVLGLDDEIKTTNWWKLVEVVEQVWWKWDADRHAGLLLVEEKFPILDPFRPERGGVNDPQSRMEKNLEESGRAGRACDDDFIDL